MTPLPAALPPLSASPAPMAAAEWVRAADTQPEPRPAFFLVQRSPDPDEIDFPDYDFADGTLFHEAGVRFFDAGRVVRADTGELALRLGELVMCDVDRGLQLATVVIPTRRALSRGQLPVRVVRRAHDGDRRADADRRKREQDAYHFVAERVRERDLPMKVVRIEISHGGSKATILFASEERIDFRELVRDIGSQLHMRVEMRQIGVRDSTKVLGGVGPCGLQLCCNTFLQDFAPVSIRHAKDQSLALNPTKISGVCGRLMCCLVYEEAFYRVHRKLLPKIGKRVMTPRGEGRVRDVDVLKQTARVELADREGALRLVEFGAAEIVPIAPPAAGGKEQRTDSATPEQQADDEPEVDEDEPKV